MATGYGRLATIEGFAAGRGVRAGSEVPSLRERGTDQDCDGNDDDQDGDGYALADDCDDLDATIHEGCPTDDDTGETGDGDGGDKPGDCGCAAPARPATPGVALLLLAMLALRRRRSP